MNTLKPIGYATYIAYQRQTHIRHLIVKAVFLSLAAAIILLKLLGA